MQVPTAPPQPPQEPVQAPASTPKPVKKPQGKTVKQLSEELGVTKQAIFDKKKQLESELVDLVVKFDGVWYFTLQAETLIKQAFNKKEPSSALHQLDTKNNTDFIGNLIATLQHQLEVKDRQLETKNKQIEELTQTIKLQAESINANRKNELAGTLIDGQKKLLQDNHKKKKWWNRKGENNE